MLLGQVFLGLNFLLAVDCIGINFDLTVGSVEPLIFSENQGINFYSQSVSLDKCLVHVLNEKDQSTLLVFDAQIISHFQQHLKIKAFDSVYPDFFNRVGVSLFNQR